MHQVQALCNFCTVFELLREKTNNFNFRPGPPQTGLYSLRSRLEARNFGFKNYIHSENKDADQSCAGNCTADLRLCFYIGRLLFFYALAHLILNVSLVCKAVAVAHCYYFCMGVIPREPSPVLGRGGDITCYSWFEYIFS